MDTADKVLLGTAAATTGVIVWVLLSPHGTPQGTGPGPSGSTCCVPGVLVGDLDTQQEYICGPEGLLHPIDGATAFAECQYCTQSVDWSAGAPPAGCVSPVAVTGTGSCLATTGSPCQPSSTGQPTAAPCSNFHNCWAYYATDTGKGYILDPGGTFHWVRDPCAWWQCGYPWPVSTATHTTTQAIMDCANSRGGLGMDVCNDSNDCLYGCPTCNYHQQCGFICGNNDIDFQGMCASSDCQECSGQGCGVNTLDTSGNAVPSPHPCSCGMGPRPGCAGLAAK